MSITDSSVKLGKNKNKLILCLLKPFQSSDTWENFNGNWNHPEVSGTGGVSFILIIYFWKPLIFPVFREIPKGQKPGYKHEVRVQKESWGCFRKSFVRLWIWPLWQNEKFLEATNRLFRVPWGQRKSVRATEAQICCFSFCAYVWGFPVDHQIHRKQSKLMVQMHS